MNQKTDMREALQLCIDAMLHDGVPTDPYHPRRIALNAAEAALASRPDAQADESGAWEYSFIHSSATGRGDSKVGPCLTYDREIAYGVGCIEQREVIVSSTHTAAPQAEAAQGVPEGITEGLEILDNFIASVRENGNYSPETTLNFIGQARQCFAAPSPDREQVGEAYPSPAVSHCQNGGDVCLAGNRDGVCCPEDSCDIDDGVRKAPISSDDLDRLLIALGLEPRTYRRSDGHLLVGAILSALAKKHAADASPSRECGERQGKIINEYPANPAELRRHARAIRMKDQACLEAACVLEWAALEIEGLRCRLEGARAPTLGEQHSDDVAVDAFASAMKAKMADARANGRSGWQCMSASDLSRMLREHVEKGDPRDVANFCMMLWMNCVPIAPAVAQPLAEIKAAYVDWELVERVRGAEEIDSEEAGMLGAMIDGQAREIAALRALIAKVGAT